MSRSVVVNLKADVGEYTVPIIAAKKETESLDNKVEALNRDLDKTPAAATRAAAAMKLLGGDAKGAGKQLNDLGPQATNSLELIEKKLEDARLRVKTFADEFNKTGSADSFNLWQKATGDVKGLEKLQKSLTGALSDGAKAAEKDLAASVEGSVERGFVAGLKNAFLGHGAGSGLPAGLTNAIANSPLWAKILVGAAPLLLPAAGALLLGGLGLGVIGAGIAGQLGSQEVKNALGRLKTDAGQVFSVATAPFGGVLTRELQAADDLLHKISPQLTEMFAKVAPSADHFFAGLNGFVEQSLPGLDKGLTGANVVLDELGRDLPAVGKAIGDAFANAATGAEGEAKALHDLLTIVDQVIAGAGLAAGASGQVYNTLRDVATLNFDDMKKSGISLNDVVQTLTTGGIYPAAKALYHYATGGDKAKQAQDEAAKSAKTLKTNMEVAAASIDLAGGSAMSASDQYGMLISQLNAVNNTADKVAGAMVDRIINPLLNADRAANNFDKSLVTLGDTLEKNGGHLSEHVKALKKAQTGQQDNKDAILAVVQANLQEYDSQIAVGVAATDAAAKYDVNTKALEDQLHAAGYTSAQIDDLIGKYRKVPDNVNTAIALNGIADAINNLADLERAIHGIPKLTVVTIEEQYRTSGTNTGNVGHATGAIRHAAFGMIVPPRSPGTLIGEPQTGGEALIPLRGISQMRAASLGQVAMSGYGLDVVPRGYQSVMSGGAGSINITISSTATATEFEQAATSWFMGAVRKGDIQLTATRV